MCRWPTKIWRYTGLLCWSVAGVGCLQSREREPGPAECTACHGSEASSPDALIQAAPPNDVFGNRGAEYPGVGAHKEHLFASETHAAVPCQECHKVPKTTAAPGHIDSALPAEVLFGPLATHEGREAHYDASRRNCANTYCHGAARPGWTEPRRSSRACGSCHALPPPAPHPASQRCATCHPQVVDDQGRIIAPKLHVNGIVEVRDSGCSACHGTGDNAAPPVALDGEADPSVTSVGAHQAHLRGGEYSRALACDECHVVPNRVEDPRHLDPSPAEVEFSDVAASADHTPIWERQRETCSGSWCHSPSDARASARWTHTSGPLPCTSCHGMPPAAPHPQSALCADCHADVASEDHLSIKAPQRHVDGQVDVAVPNACDACHGGQENAAPPRDLLGNMASSSPGVGAHQAHLTASGRARPLGCAECHRVPTAVLDDGHVDSPLPAEVEFGAGPARAFLATPTYDSGSCAQTFCHGDTFIGGRPSGGTHTVPEWTETHAAAATCTSCHGMPPPAPHPQGARQCSECHQNAGPGNTWRFPARHVDGVVTFFIK